jgi:pyridoxamine 5'-phosphate oxidase
MSAHGDHFSAHRREYTRAGLEESTAGADPFALLQRWLDEAAAAGVQEPNALTFAAVEPDGTPTQRVLLLKHLDGEGLVVFTNYESRKGRALTAHPHASVHFFWKELERQVAVEGVVERVEAELSDRYFASRPRDSQLGALASAQSRPIASRAELEAAFAAAAAAHADGRPVARPAHWGGYRLRPRRFEFWQGRPNRLHDRLEFRRAGDTWQRRRLSP